MEEPAPSSPSAPGPLARRRVSPPAIAITLAAALAFAGWLLSRDVGIGEASSAAPETGNHLPRLDGRKGAWGYNLEPAALDLERIFYSRALESIPALSKPDILPGSALAAHGTDASPGGWVAGIVAGGKARAYPGRLLEMHDVVNDEVGGEPVAVAYDGLGDELTAFSRRIDGAAVEFGCSGLRYDNALLLVDRRPDPHDQSLWCPLLMQAATGPAAVQPKRLQPIDVERTTWSDWLARHPDTTVAGTLTGFSFDYSHDNFTKYFGDGILIYPKGKGSGRRKEIPAKSRMLIAASGESRRAYLFSDLEKAGGSLTDRLGDAQYRIALSPSAFGPVAAIEPLNEAAKAMTRRFAFWFVWDAIDPRGELYESAAKP